MPDLHAEYAAKGWPSVDHRAADYCYQPCPTGLHVCGEHPDGLNALTVANFPMAGARAARELFARARRELACAEGEDGDLVVDLMLGGDCDTDFLMRRQMLDRLRVLAAQV